VDDAFDLVGETDGVEIDEESDVLFGHAKVGENLSLVDGQKFGDGFEFDNECVFNE
jgi:hypothetical protein